MGCWFHEVFGGGEGSGELVDHDHHHHCPYCTALVVLGSVTALIIIVKFLLLVWRVFLRPGHDLVKRYKKGDVTPWALITGGSDGIGKAFALDLAQRGFNILLVARTESKLKNVQADVKAVAPNAKVEYAVLDIGKAGYDTVRATIDKECSTRDIALLVNNAGVAIMPNYLAEYDEDTNKQAQDLIDVNVVGFTAVLTGALPHIVKRGVRGGVINTSSGSALIPFPLNSTYAASKAFNKQMSDSVHFELRKNNIDVLSYTPLFVQSNMVRKKTDIMVVKASTSVAGCLRCLGHDMTTVGCTRHRFQVWFSEHHTNMACSFIEKGMVKARDQLAAKAKEAKKGE